MNLVTARHILSGAAWLACLMFAAPAAAVIPVFIDRVGAPKGAEFILSNDPATPGGEMFTTADGATFAALPVHVRIGAAGPSFDGTLQMFASFTEPATLAVGHSTTRARQELSSMSVRLILAGSGDVLFDGTDAVPGTARYQAHDDPLGYAQAVYAPGPKVDVATYGFRRAAGGISVAFLGTAFPQLGPDGSIASSTGYFRSAYFHGSVPEPAAWALLIMGFGLAGVGLRTRRHTLAPVVSPTHRRARSTRPTS